MKPFTDRSRLRLYLWMSLGYFFLGLLTTISSRPDIFFAAAFNNLWGVVYVCVLNFLLFEYSLPFVLKKRSSVGYNIALGLLLLWVHLMLYSFGSYCWRFLGMQLHVYTPLRDFSSVNEVLQNQMAYSTGSVFLFGIVRHAYNYQQLKQAAQQLRIQKQEAELNYLKSQTNPHFLFNTLNNIYALTRDKSDRAPESVLRLSKILRFMLYEAGGNYISIEQELKIIDDYIALEKLRYDDTLQVDFNYNVEDKGQSLPPLLLMPLVENAFKHGVSETRHRPFVNVHLSVAQRRLVFVVKNSTGDDPEERRVKENIGLSNLRRQLQLLYTDYHLAVQQETPVFVATLKINLASHV